MKQFDLIVIGGGSGGIAMANQAAKLGAKCAVIEQGHLGGTCVNLGCVPKKVMWNASHIAESIHKAKDYGFEVNLNNFNWAELVLKRQSYIERLRQIYKQRFNQLQITLISGHGQFVGEKCIRVDDYDYKADHIVIAVGGEPIMPDIPGIEHAISSDGFFALTKQPAKVAIVGGGYIGVEIAGVLNGLGSEVYLLNRYDSPLRRFEPMLGSALLAAMQQQGMHVLTNRQAVSLNRDEQNKLTLYCSEEDKIGKLDEVIFAVGRSARTKLLHLEKAEVKVEANGTIAVDKYQNSNVSGIYAIGDVTGAQSLTPVAIAAGRCLARRLFGDEPQCCLDYKNICTVVFSHPPIATVGISEPEAVAQYGLDQVKVYHSKFNPMVDAICAQKIPTEMKLVTVGVDEKVVGCHIIGYGADEILQGFGVAIKMGARKRDFDNTIAIHPTSAEELVTMT